jgi:RecA-family ATPase
MAISVSALKDKPLPTNDWIINGLLTRKNTGFLMGPPKRAAKSWLLLAAAWNLSEGFPIWGMSYLSPPRQMRVVYFTQEDTEADIQKRVLIHINGGRREPNDRLWLVPKNLNIKLDTQLGEGLIKRELDSVVAQAGAIDLVMLDPFRRMHDGDENDSSVIAKLWRTLEKIHNTYDCSTLIAHHVKKPPNDRSAYDPTDPNQGRGSGDIYGGGDAFVMVVPGPTAPDGKSWRQVTLHYESKRGEQMPPTIHRVWLTTGQVQHTGAVAPA